MHSKLLDRSNYDANLVDAVKVSLPWGESRVNDSKMVTLRPTRPGGEISSILKHVLEI